MVNVQYGNLLEEDIQNDSIIPFENGSGLTKRSTALKQSNLVNGSSVVIIASENDLPSLMNGTRTLEFNKNYLFTEPGTYVDKITIPAGWTGQIRKSFFNSTSLVFIGSTMFSTLNIDGIIDSIADSITNPGVKSTVTTSVAHGLLDGQFVNITDTLVETLYTQQSLQISNVTATTFDIEIVFTNTDTGNFNTGYGSILFVDFGAVGTGANAFLDITSAGVPGTSLLFTRFAAANFSVVAQIHNAVNIVSHDTIFAYIGAGLILEDCISASLSTTEFIALNPIAPSIGLDIFGSLTKRIGVSNCLFTMSAITHFPVFIAGNTVTNADEIIFTNSPDNNVATDYFDTAGGGLDQKDPQVIALNNGTRPNSQIIGSAFVNTNVAQTTIAAADTFQDINFGTLTPSASIERNTLDNVANGEFTYTGLQPLSSPLTMSITMRKVGGATEIYHIKFVVDKGSGFVDFDDNIILPFEIKTVNSSATYVCRAQLENGDILKPQISGIGTTDDIVVDSVSISF